MTASDLVFGVGQEIGLALVIHSRLPSHPFCSVHLINGGLRLERGGELLEVEFAGTGLSRHSCAKFQCALDQRETVCKQPTPVIVV